MMMLIRRNILFLLFILSLVGIAAFLNQAWLFDPFGWVDHWAYVGISLYFEKYKVLFNNHPAIELLPVTLPSAFLYSLFDPLTAKIIKDMAFAVTLLLAIFYSVKAFFGSVCAFMVATFSVGYEYLLSTFGSDYTDSAVATYYGIALLFCILASKEKGKFEYLYLSISGFFYGLMLTLQF